MLIFYCNGKLNGRKFRQVINEYNKMEEGTGGARTMVIFHSHKFL
jgi:hypothetical protein